MFNGFSDETFEFFMAIAFNNNRDFFQANHDWYLRAVREPCLALAEALGPVALDLDEHLDTRPNRVVSRINRDIRFSRDKSPYRDYMWLSFRRAGPERGAALGLYFDISHEGASCGMGFYVDNAPWMNGLRRRLLQAPSELLDLWRPLEEDFLFFPRVFKRMKLPEDLAPELAEWYRLRSFYLQKPLPDFELLKSPRLAEEIAGAFRRLKPLYRYLDSIPPEEDTKDA